MRPSQGSDGGPDIPTRTAERSILADTILHLEPLVALHPNGVAGGNSSAEDPSVTRR